MNFPASLFYPSDAFDVDANQVMGRRVAGRLLIKAFASSLSPGEEISFFTLGEPASHALRELLKGALPDGASARIFATYPSFDQLVSSGAFCIPDPSLAHWSSLRAGGHHASFSLIGVIHTICSEGVLKSLADIPLAPLYSWDAIVCTSKAGQSVVSRVIEHRIEAIKRRFSSHAHQDSSLGMPSLPIIPLPGPQCQPFHPELTRDQRRIKARQSLGIAIDDFVVVFVGRLSFHSKCHPLSLYRALQRLAESNPSQSITLIECGHQFNSHVAEAYEQLRSQFANVNFYLVGGANPATEEEKWSCLAAADVFSSPVDNLQETFGLSVVEAMYAELPLVISDWSGYRDLVLDGVNGFLIPTYDLQAGHSGCDPIDIAYSSGKCNYDSMIGLRSLGVALDHDAYAKSFQLLLDDPSLRLKMSKAGLERYMLNYSVDAVARAYRGLLSELAQRRDEVLTRNSDISYLPSYMPSHSEIFHHFPSASIPFSDVVWTLVNPAATSHLYDKMNQELVSLIVGSGLHALVNLLLSQRCLSTQSIMALGYDEFRARATLALLFKFGIVSPVK